MTNRDIIEQYFTALSQRDFIKMNSLYSEDIIYSDPLFGLLSGDEVRDRWEMACKNLKEFSLTILEFEEIDHEYSTCRWRAEYFSADAGKKIIFTIKSFLKISEGKIIEHSDAYRMSDWIALVYGWKGQLFGWTGAMQRKAQEHSRSRLQRFSKSKIIFQGSGKRRHDYDSFDQ